MKTIGAIFAFVVFFLPCSAYARPSESLINYPSIPVAVSSGKALTADQVCKIVREAAEEKKWLVGAQPDGKLLASLSWNSSKHTIVIEIGCSDAGYSIVYKDSINMKFSSQDGQMTIHPHYNKFVKELNDSVRVRLMTF